MILLDTHTLIWFMFDDSKLSARALSAIKSENKVYVSVASFWEIAVKQSIGKISITGTIQDIADKCSEVDISILPIEPKHLDNIKDLPDIHKDPFDRLIVSQAITENMVLVTKDAIIPQYGVTTIW